MIKAVSVIRRKPGLSVEDFQHYWRHTHALLVSRLPGLRRYVQSHTLRSGYAKGQPAADGVVELWFDDLAAMQALKGTPELAAVLADEPNFVDMATFRQVLTTDHLIKDGAIPPAGVKNIEFVTRRPDLSIDDFQRYWRTVHGPLAAKIAPIRRYVQSHTRPGAYARSTPPALDGFAFTWFVDTTAMRESARTAEYAAVRADEENFLTIPLDFVIAREHVIVG